MGLVLVWGQSSHFIFVRAASRTSTFHHAYYGTFASKLVSVDYIEVRSKEEFAAVMKYGKNQWPRIASLLSRKSANNAKLDG